MFIPRPLFLGCGGVGSFAPVSMGFDPPRGAQHFHFRITCKVALVYYLVRAARFIGVFLGDTWKVIRPT
jgi:hypothetical protein